MHIIPPSAFRTQPWKNGGGITHEIAREDRGGTLLWRLSIAEVASDGPFSAFPGLARILTVFEGAGLHLDTPAGRLAALPLVPLPFSGDLPVECRRIAGNVRDFNVIYDPSRIRATVTLLERCTVSLSNAQGRGYAALALDPGITMAGRTIPETAVVRFEAGALDAPNGTAALLVTFDQL